MFFRSSIGLDIHSDKIIVVCVKKTMRGIRVTHHSVFSFNMEKNDTEHFENFRLWFETFLKENQTLGRGFPDIYIGIPREKAVIKKVRFPMAAKENLYSAVRFDLEKHVPLPEDEICFDYHILSEDKEKDQLHLILIIARKQEIISFLDRLERSESISGIDLSKSGLINSVEFISGEVIPEAEIWDILRKRKDADQSIDISNTTLPSPHLAPAFGLAIKGLTHVPVNINLIPPARRKKPNLLAVYTLTVLTILVFLSLIIFGSSYFIRQKMALKRLDTHLATYSAEVSDLPRIRLKAQKLEEKLAFFRSVQKGSISTLDILRELTRVIPENAWIRNLTFSDTGIQLEGNAETATELISLLEASPLFKDVVFLSSITKDPGGKERFRIGLEVEY